MSELDSTFFIRVVPFAPKTVTTSASSIAHVQGVTTGVGSDGPFILCGIGSSLRSGGTIDVLQSGSGDAQPQNQLVASTLTYPVGSGYQYQVQFVKRSLEPQPQIRRPRRPRRRLQLRPRRPLPRAEAEVAVVVAGVARRIRSTRRRTGKRLPSMDRRCLTAISKLMTIKGWLTRTPITASRFLVCSTRSTETRRAQHASESMESMDARQGQPIPAVAS